MLTTYFMDPSLCARTPTWIDSSSSARKESWTSRYLLPPTSSTAWRSEKIPNPFSFIVTQTKRKTQLLNTMSNQCSNVCTCKSTFAFFNFFFDLFQPFSTSSSSHSPFPPFSRVFSAWREFQWSSDSCQCSSTSCSRSWLRMIMMRSPLPPPGRMWYYNIYNWIYFRVGAQWLWLNTHAGPTK